MTIKITLNARYNFGLTKLITGIDDAFYQRVIVVTPGYKFYLTTCSGDRP